MATVDVCQIILNLLKGAGVNAFPALPANPVRPIVQVEEAGGPPSRDANGHLNKQDFQIDVWGNSKKEAQQTMAQVRDLIIQSRNYIDPPGTGNPGGVIVGARVNMPSYSKDPDLPVGNRPGPRYVMVASVTAHA